MKVHRRLTQFVFGAESQFERVQGTTGKEYFWKSVPDCWSDWYRTDHANEALRCGGSPATRHLAEAIP